MSAAAPATPPGARAGTAALADSLAHAVAFAGLAGAAHVANVYRIRELKGEFSWASRDLTWMSPLSNAVILVTIALVGWALGRAGLRFMRQSVMDGVLAGFGFLAVLLLLGGLHALAMLALAVGVGVQFGRWSSGTGVTARLARATTVAGTGLFVLLVTGGLLERATRDARAAGPLAQAAPSGAPNVLVIIWDTVRSASVSLYGSPRRTTPELERLAATATTFEWAIAPSPWTLPSHCSMFTGLQPGEHSCRWEVPLRGSPMTVAEAFRSHGWRTGAFVANPFYTTYETGLGRGFQHFSDLRTSVAQVLLASTLSQTAIGRDLARGQTFADRTENLRRLELKGDPKPLRDRKLATHVNEEFLAWQANGDAQPFFAFLNLYDAHDPYEPPAPWGNRFPEAPEPLRQYEGGIAYMDDALGQLLRELERRGVLQNTIVVVTSDHGEAFGEHGITNHGHALYLPLVHVPLVVRAPQLPAGTRVPSTVALRDLAATLLHLAGVGPVDGIGGTSFATPERLVRGPAMPALTETEKSRNFWMMGPARHGAMHALVDDSLHYIVDGKGQEELYAYRADTGEAVNLASSDSAAAARYRALLPRVAKQLVR